MDESRRAIRQGRDWAARGAYARARTTWRAAQARAYRAQDHAALFVLSVNVGEACVRLAAQSPDPAAVYEAQANLEYAVQVVHECGLEWHVGRRHSELARGVRRAEMLRREVAKLLDAMRVADDDGPTAAADAKETDSECTTCGQRRGQQRAMVLDASDGCYYCSACYEEYYATVAVDAAGDPGVNEWMADEAMNAQHDHSERDGCSVDARIAEEGGDGVLDTAASLWRPVVEDVVLHEKLDDRVDEQKTGGTTVDRIRYDRVELGSLAEYLTGKCQVGDKDEQLGSSKPSDDVDDTCVPVADASTDDDRHHVEVHRKESFAASDELQEKLREACVATVDDDSLREEETALVDEDTVDKACENRKYSIPRLLDLRRVSPRDCPECLLESPVRDDGSVCKRVHSRAGSSRKTSSSKLTPRSAACNQQTSGAATDSGQAKTPEKPEVTALVSPLPSLELCNTMRKVLKEKRQTDDRSSELSSTDGTRKKRVMVSPRTTDATQQSRPMGSHDATSAKLLLSFRTLKNALQSTRINDDEEAVLVTRMCVNPRYVDEFERLLRLILKTTHTAGHVSTCVVRPPPGEFTYTSIVKYSNLHVMRQTYPSSIEDGVEFYNLLAARDSLLLGPPMYQLEAGIFGTWIESDGNTKPMWGDDPEEDASCLVHQQRVPGPYCNDSCENPRGLSVRASFVAPTKTFQLFRQRYQRNNKKGGQKNLRCFPCCRNGRHVSSGFCGDSIKVHVAVTRVTESGGVKICPIHTTRPGVLAFARFLNLDGAFDPTVSGPEVVPGQTIEKTNVLAWVRDKQHPMSPLFPGILRGAAMETLSQSAIFEFNAECKAWHYGWTAPRGQGLSGNDTRHVLEVLFMKPMGSYMYCLERLRSDGFSIYSSRRANPAAIKPEVDAFDKQELGDKRNHKRKRMAHAENADLTPLGVPVMPQSPASPVSTIALSCPISSPIFSPAKENMKNGRRQSVTPAMRINTVPTLSTGFVEYPSSMPDVLPFKMESMVGSVSSSPMAVCPPPSSVPVDSVSASFDYQGLQNLTCSNGLPPNESAQQQLQQQLGRQQRQLLIDQQHQQLCRHRREQEELLQHKQRLIQQLAEQMMISQQHEQQLHVNDPQGSEELQNHSLFQEEQPARRVVSTDELPWTELYSLFDPSPLSPTTTDDDPDNDEESLSSSSSSPAPFSTANVSMEFSVPSVPSVPQTVLNDLS